MVRQLVLLGLLLLLSLLATGQERVAVRLRVLDAKGAALAAQITLVGKGERIGVETNRYGMAIVEVRRGASYTVLGPGGVSGGKISVPTNAGNDNELTIRLQEGKTAKAKDKVNTPVAGRGLVVFEYKESTGAPVVGAQLRALSSNGRTWTARTNGEGKAELQLPVGFGYTFSVPGKGAFAEHKYADGEVPETVYLSLVRKDEPPAPQKKKPQGGVNKDGVYVPRDRPDSLAKARRVLKQRLKGEGTPNLTLPPQPSNRKPRKPSYKATKRVVDGVLIARQALNEEYLRNPKVLLDPHFSVLPPLTRNPWRNFALVVDGTCSMDPYIEEYMLWTTLAQNSGRTLGFVIFNDGDGCADSLKRTGETGGIRHATPQIKNIVDTVLYSRTFGCSGDVPENDCEALLYAERVYPKAESIVLIADNQSPVRDIALYTQLRLPVHILLCSGNTEEPPHADYVMIAHATGGTIHYLNEDMTLKSGAEPGVYALGKWAYERVRNRFVVRAR